MLQDPALSYKEVLEKAHATTRRLLGLGAAILSAVVWAVLSWAKAKGAAKLACIGLGAA